MNPLQVVYSGEYEESLRGQPTNLNRLLERSIFVATSASGELAVVGLQGTAADRQTFPVAHHSRKTLGSLLLNDLDDTNCNKNDYDWKADAEEDDSSSE